MGAGAIDTLDRLPDWSAVRSVLLIRLRSIGDTVLMTPCLAALKSLHPEIKISVVSEGLAAPILETHPLVDHLIIAERSLADRLRLIRELRRLRLDVAFNMHGGTTATWLARLSGAKWTIGYRGYRHSGLLDLRAPDPDEILGRREVHSVEQQLALLHWAGVPWPQTQPLVLTVSPEAQSSIRQKLAIAIDQPADGGSFAVVAPAAGFESKRWIAAGFAEVALHIRERWKLPSVVIAGPGQESLAREVAAQAGAVSLTGLSLQELTALIGLSAAFVGNDGGPMHIAAALRRPLVAVFGSSNRAIWRPWTDSPYRVVGGGRSTAGIEDADTPRQKDTDTPAGRGTFAIRGVAPNEVIAAVDDVMNLAVAIEAPGRRE